MCFFRFSYHKKIQAFSRRIHLDFACFYLGSLHNSSIRIGSDGISVVCGDDLDKSENDENTEGNEKEAEENKADEKEVVDKAATEKSETKTSAEKEAEHLGKGITCVLVFIPSFRFY